MTLRPITEKFALATNRQEIGTGSDTTLYAGGTDVIPLARAGVITPVSLVDIKQSGVNADIEQTDDGWLIGALVTLSELGSHTDLIASIPAIGDAVEQIATLQIRNRATVGGNLLQRPRCSYFRDPDVECWMKGGSTCPALDGRNEHLALSGDTCVAPQPSDLASVWTALGATVTISRRSDPTHLREVDIAEFLAGPTEDHRSLHTLGDDEVIEAVKVPRPQVLRSTYVKAMDRAVWQFALVGVAVSVDAVSVDADSSNRISAAKLVASGVSNTPLVLEAAADVLIGEELTPDVIRRAADVTTEGLTSLSENAYKLSLLRGLTVRALERLA